MTVEALLEDVRARLGALERQVARRDQDHDTELLLLRVLASRTFVDHVTIEEAALVRGVSTPTIRRRIRRGDFVLEVIPGTKITGIPIKQVFPAWISLDHARTARQKERRDG